MHPTKKMELGVLCMLNEEGSQTVEEIHDRLHHSFGRYWSPGTGALKPTVDRLADEGRVEAGEGVGTYEITEEGVTHLQELVREPVEGIFYTNDVHVLLKLGAIHHLPPGEVDEQLRAVRDRAMETRDGLLTAKEEHRHEIDEPTRYGYRHELTDLNVAMLDAFVDWIEAIRSTDDGF